MKARITAFCLMLVLLLVTFEACAIDDGYRSSYTYNYDYWLDIRESPDAYMVDRVIYNATLGLDKPMKHPQSLYVRDNYLYVCDTDNNRILEIVRKGNDYELVRIIESINGAEPAGFSGPNDVFVDEEMNIYVADTNNNRVVMMDSELNFIKQFIKPVDVTFDQSQSFLPSKIVADAVGRLYVLATNVNKGLMKFESDTTFTGYVGANKVSYSLYEYIWKSYILSEEQKNQQEAFVPTEYHNICMDEDGFIFATNTVFDSGELLYGSANPIRRLNAVGTDILIRNDRYGPVGDLYWKDDTDQNGPSRFYDITAMENGIYVAFDHTRGRVFGYDQQGIMMWAFGTKGNVEGAFMSGVSIEHMGRDLFCLDENEGTITVFTPTEYGTLIYDAYDAYTRGDYDGSALKWREVLRLNANNNMAFIGIGRALLRQDDYSGAMKYFEMAHDKENYGRAFKLYRKECVENNIGWIVGIAAAVVVVLIVVGRIRKMRWEMYEYERNRVVK